MTIFDSVGAIYSGRVPDSYLPKFTKYCSNCKQEKTLDKFSRNKSKPDGFEYSCRECEAKRQREMYRSKNNEIQTNNKI